MATSSTAVTATKGPKLKVLPFDPHGDWLDLGKRWGKWFERFERDLKYNGCDPSKTPQIAKMALLIYAGTETRRPARHPARTRQTRRHRGNRLDCV